MWKYALTATAFALAVGQAQAADPTFDALGGAQAVPMTAQELEATQGRQGETTLTAELEGGVTVFMQILEADEGDTLTVDSLFVDQGDREFEYNTGDLVIQFGSNL